MVRGRCRAEDVSQLNTVYSTQLHDLEVTQHSEGELRRASSKPWITRLLESVLGVINRRSRRPEKTPTTGGHVQPKPPRAPFGHAPRLGRAAIGTVRQITVIDLGQLPQSAESSSPASGCNQVRAVVRDAGS